MISSLTITRFVVQLSPRQECSAEKSDKLNFCWLRQLYAFHPSVLLLTIKISQSARENSLSYCKIYIYWRSEIWLPLAIRARSPRGLPRQVYKPRYIQRAFGPPRFARKKYKNKNINQRFCLIEPTSLSWCIAFFFSHHATRHLKWRVTPARGGGTLKFLSHTFVKWSLACVRGVNRCMQLRRPMLFFSPNCRSDIIFVQIRIRIT